MAERFARGGRLVAPGSSPAARSDVRHVTVEFVHPVIVGKRALPAIALRREGGPLAGQLELIREPDDIALPSGERRGRDRWGPHSRSRLQRGCLTIAFGAGAGEWELVPAEQDPCIRQELVETALSRALGAGPRLLRAPRPAPGRGPGRAPPPGHQGFLYPFLAEGERGRRRGDRRRPGFGAGEG